MAGRLDGKAAIITGGGSSGSEPGAGIGQAIAISLAREGAVVVVVDKVAERAEATVRDIEQAGGRGVVVQGDVTSESDCEMMVRVTRERFGGLDILVNNAAISRHVAITETSIELYEEVIGVNLTGSFLAAKFAIPALIDRGGGSIVNIGSIASIRDSGTSHPAYCASKAAQLGLTIDLAGAYGRANVRVNAVLPGIIATPMMASVGTVADDVRARLNLLGRIGDAWDVANAVVFLCSDAAAYITGVVLPVDGGATAAMPGSAFRSAR